MIVFSQIRSVVQHLSKRLRLQLLFWFILMIFASFAEALSIASVIPFLAVIAEPTTSFYSTTFESVVKLFNLKNPGDLLWLLTIFFVAASILSGSIRIAMVWTQSRVGANIGAELSASAFENVLYRPYSSFAVRNSSEAIADIQKTASLVGALILPSLTLLSSAITLLVILITLIRFDPLVTLGAALGLGFIYFSIVFKLRATVSKNSKVIAMQHGKLLKIIQEGLGGIRDIIIDNAQSIFVKSYRRANAPLQISIAGNQFLGSAPRHAVESLGIAAIAIIAYSLGQGGLMAQQNLGIISILGVLALSAQRVLPLVQQGYLAYSIMRGNERSIQDVLDVLSEEPTASRLQTTKQLNFNEVIELEDISFRYSEESPWILRNFCLKINRGSRVAIIGPTGSGKSTLLDIIMGLLLPTEGSIYVDRVKVTKDNIGDWQKSISHVPQSIYLADCSIAQNIAFGVPKVNVDMEKIRRVAKIAQIANLIETLPAKYDTEVGERGARLSGGQRQRIGIARALYKETSLQIFDEATSALDEETEASLIAALDKLSGDVTHLFVTHRLSILSRCDAVIKINT